MTLIDTHAHLDDERFADDLAEVLQRAVDAGVERVLTIGIDLKTSEAAVRLAHDHAMLSAVVGIQPNCVAEAHEDDFDAIVALANDVEVVAIGESGLDRYWDKAPFELQQLYFAKHLRLARTLSKPIVIHCREADADVVTMLRADYDEYGPIAGVMHSFCGDATTAEACLTMGMYLSFAGMLTYKTAANLREVAATIPLERLLIETDSPYLAPVPKRGQRNEPSFVAHTAAVLADVVGVRIEELTAATTANAKRLFSN